MARIDAADEAPVRTPVALFLFRRPDNIARVFERVREARPAHLFLIADGPRPGAENEARDCAAARAVVEGVDWPCEVHRKYAEGNLGLKRRIPSGIDWVFEHVDRAILLEDDCLPHPSFFRWCDELLERYAQDERVMHVAGSQLLPSPPARAASYHFSRYVHIWGWATWRRAWRRYDVDLSDWHALPEDVREERLRAMFDEESERRYWRYVWDNSGEIDNWDAQWSYALLSRDGLAINPNRNLIRNIGFGNQATFAIEDPHGIGDRPLEGIGFPLEHPRAVSRDLEADEVMSHIFRRPEPPPPLPQQRAWRRGWERFRWRVLRAGGRALDFVPEPIRPRIRHRDRQRPSSSA